jgi:hypothetical protein
MTSAVRSLVSLFSLIGVLLISVHASADEPRQWTDATGKFKVTATLEERTEDSVVLRGKDGKKLTIKISKLSKEDQKYLAEQGEENPFAEMSEEEADSKPASKKSSKEESSDSDSPDEESPKSSKVDWDEVELIEILGGDRWEIPMPETAGLGYEPKKIPLPKKGHFFEGMQELAINPVKKRVAIGYLTGFSLPTPVARLVLGDFESGKMVSSETVEANMKPLCLLHDGATVLMMGFDEKGEGADSVQSWRLKGKKIERGTLWKPFADEEAKDDRRGRNGREQAFLAFGESIDENLVLMCSRGGHLALWDISKKQPKWHAQLGEAPAVSFSTDRSLITFVNGQQIVVMATKTGEIVGQISIADKGHLPWPKVAFSPSGKRLGLAAWDRLLVLDVEKKEWIQELAFPGSNVGNAFAFPDEEYVLFDNKVLIHWPTRIQLWTLQEVHAAKVVGDFAFLGCNTDGGGMLFPTKLPHAKAIATLQSAQKQNDLFIVRPGAEIGINVSAVPAQYQQKAQAGLQKAIEKIGCKVSSNAAVQIVASISGPKQEAVSYHMSGSHVVQSYLTKIALQYKGQDAWATSGTNIPGMVMLSRDETMESYLAKASQSPNVSIFDGLQLPEYLQKPAVNNGQPNQPQPFNTIGASKLTMNGLQ